MRLVVAAGPPEAGDERRFRPARLLIVQLPFSPWLTSTTGLWAALTNIAVRAALDWTFVAGRWPCCTPSGVARPRRRSAPLSTLGSMRAVGSLQSWRWPTHFREFGSQPCAVVSDGDGYLATTGDSRSSA